MRVHTNSRPGLPCTRNGKRGMTLVEMIMGAAVASLVLVIIGVLSVYGLRSFIAMGNYAELDGQTRMALDQITLDIRQASRVLSFQTNDYSKTLVLSNALRGMTIRYVWDADMRTLTCSKNEQSEVIYLKDCESWDVELYQAAPQPGSPMAFLPATNVSGAFDPDSCRLVTMTWKCSRPILDQWSTESVQTLQVALRNK